MSRSVLSEIEAVFERGATGHLLQRQTTRLDIECDSLGETAGQGYRIHLRGKRDIQLTSEWFRSFRLLEQHPLLLEYTDPGGTLYLASKIEDTGPLITEMRAATEDIFGGWRPLDYFLNPEVSFEELLSKSYGSLLSGPKPLTDRVLKVAERHRLALTFHPSSRSGTTAAPKVLLMDRSFIIADRFDAEHLLQSRV
jgi:hypothetical protein